MKFTDMVDMLLKSDPEPLSFPLKLPPELTNLRVVECKLCGELVWRPSPRTLSLHLATCRVADPEVKRAAVAIINQLSPETNPRLPGNGRK